VTTDLVVSLYDRSGIMVRPWAEAGYECICVDIAHRPIRKARREIIGQGSITFQWGDARVWYPPRSPCILFAFPPCTHVSGSGARDYKLKGTGLLRDSLEMWAAAYHAGKWSGVPFMIENPVGKFSDHMGRPDFYFHPWQYGDPWFKKTCLWTGNGFAIPAPLHAEPPEGTTEKIWLMSPGDDRDVERSETPPGFAREVFKANYGMIRSVELEAAA
jgi:hypothetical protein